jgi:nucleotidyltransferase/DNA polymerase involved in DNA repair
MGAPYFQIRVVLRKHGVQVFSSNYALYGDMSERVMSIIQSMVPTVEVYSIDEAYANGALVELPYPTNDVRLLTKAATEAVHRLFRPGFKYSKQKCC